MQGTARFSGYLLIFDMACLILAGVPVYLLAGPEVFITIPIALLITTLLAVASFYPFTRISSGSVNSYMAAMLGGMLIRMIFIGFSVALVFAFTDLHQIGFTVGLLFSYICKSVIETYILTRKQRGQSSVS